MAEAGAHLTSSTADELPSIFEVLAQESLMEAVKPALRYAVKVLAESNPSQFGFLWRCFDELYLLLDLLLQNHFLSHCSASFSENFYGLKRVPGCGPVPAGLHRTSHWLSLLLLCLVPYLRAKLEASLARQRDEEDFSIRLAQSASHRLYRAAVGAYPYVGGFWRVLVFCQQLLFVFGTSRTHSPLLWLAQVRLARLNAQDLRDLELKSSKRTTTPTGSLVRRAWDLMSQTAGGVAMSLSASLSVGVFFLQFLEWWYSSDNHTTVKTLTSSPIPPPPLHLQAEHVQPGSTFTSASANQGAEAQRSYGRTCPLCLCPRTNATVLSTSGLVFCYRCIYTYVKTKHRCPVTAYPTQLQHLIKIYAADA